MRPVGRRLSAVALLVSLVGATSVAAAHGREPIVGAITFDPADPEHLLVRTTWALLESHDDGATFTWRCAAAVGYDRTTEDPPIAIVESGETFAGTFDGVTHGSCAWSLVDDPDAVGEYAIDLERDPSDPRALWLLMSPGAADNRLVRSLDEGVSWDTVGVPRAGEPTFLAERMALAPSDPSRIYVSGAVPATSTTPMRAAFFYRSSDGGRTFAEREMPLEGEERNAHVLGVDPTDPDRVFLRMTRRVTDEMPERLLLSEDGGETWTLAASLLEITGLAISDDGQHVWVGGWDGAFLRSDARGAPGTFVPVATAPDLRVRCLSWRAPRGSLPGELWVCVDDIVGNFALGRSTDLGATLEPVWGFEDASPDTGCPRCTPVGIVCPEYWGDVVFDLGLRVDAGVTLDAALPFSRDAGVPTECIDGAVVEMDAGVGPDAGVARAPASCACAVAPRATALGSAAALFGGPLAWITLLASSRARRRESCRGRLGGRSMGDSAARRAGAV